ncbi:MAG: Uncharacterized protein XD43_0811 [Thermococcales archaeon 44_46]|jgi:hypothetical protein|uniref:hypothetical protein n=1 Tax=Thermococcus sp. 101 C5 TaxID=2654197 RepID=UPI000749914B|nr:hypothetical protein [Thermococcus sp. 101 C5]KUJ99515.1 MAG: Uncharacterized protein XD43_0811 [Thermococcales archaeon 44_46]MPW39982.1 hypothetical protein [Thermococcus sp. 101 C5]
MKEFEIKFKFYGGYETFDRMGREIIEHGLENGESPDVIITKCLEEYEAWMYYKGNEIFQATVDFDVFVSDLIALAFYSLRGDVPGNIDFNGRIFTDMSQLPGWWRKEAEKARAILEERFGIVTTNPVFCSTFGSYDPTVIIFAFTEGEDLHLVSTTYNKVARLSARKIAEYVAEVVGMAITELEKHIGLFEEFGIKEYAERVKTLREKWELLKSTLAD